MKKLVILLLLTLLGWLTVNGQTGRPCAEYDQNRDISGMKEILMKDGIFYTNLRASYAEAINYGIGKNVVTTSKYGMEYVLENTILLDVNFIVPDDYLNGVRFGDKVTFTTLKGQPSDKWAAFRYEGVDYVYAKVSCMNSQRIKKMGSFLKIKPEPTPLNLSSVKTDDNWTYVPPKKVYENEVPDLNLTPEKDKEKKEKKFFGRNLWWEIPVGLLITGGSIYGISQISKNRNVPPPPVIPPEKKQGFPVDAQPQGKNARQINFSFAF